MRIYPWLSLQIVIISFLLLVPPCLGADTITTNHSLTGYQTIESRNQKFVLGFFNPVNSSNFYIGIWYTEVSELTPVWVANRDSPVSDRGSYLLKFLDGNLVLTTAESEKPPVWSTNLSTATTISKSLEAVLLNYGNFVLRDHRNPSQFIWQSFDHPTDTWLPGAKLRWDKNTKTAQQLTAWKSLADPAKGLYSLELSPNGTGELKILWNSSVQYWTSGAWDHQQNNLAQVPEMSKLKYVYNFSFIDNEIESYFTYSVYDPSIYTARMVIDISGQFKLLRLFSKTWTSFWSKPEEQCNVYAFCGAFGNCSQNSHLDTCCSCLTGFSPKSNSDWILSDYSGGCVRNTQLQCGGNGTARNDPDEFLLYPNMGLPKDPEYVIVTGTPQRENCESVCLKKCSCAAYTYNSSGCFIWIGDLLDLKQFSDGHSSGENLYLRLATDDRLPRKSNHLARNSNERKVVPAVVGSIVAVLLVLLGIVLAIHRENKRRLSSNTTTTDGSLIVFAYKDLQNATKNFSEKLGEGGFGLVFKGTLPDSSVIAVKKLESINQGEKQFRTEVTTIGKIHHLNLVRLLGFCSEGINRLLVYDYMPNKSLEAHLFCQRGSEVLQWEPRYHIALGIAKGLTYLHENCNDCIIHCDIKPENILLDADYRPKVADFGMAKLIGRDFSRVLTTMRGTRGYLAPEWLSGMAITAKADVYSYGMMLFEMLSGHRNTEQFEDDDRNIMFFPSWATAQIITAREDILSILDKRLEGQVNREEAEKIFKLACWCIQDHENQRPTMGQVVQILEGVLDVHMPPIPKSLQLFVENQETIVFFTELSSSESSRSRNNNSSILSNLEQHQHSAINAARE